MVRNQDANATVLEMRDKIADFTHGDGIDPRQGFVEKDEFGVRGKTAGELFE